MGHNIKFYPEFYFNLNSSILGSLSPSLSFQSHHLTHEAFIAILLLPCANSMEKSRSSLGMMDLEMLMIILPELYTHSPISQPFTPNKTLFYVIFKARFVILLIYQAFLICSTLFQVCLTMTRTCVWSIPKAICTFLIYKIYIIRNEP